MVPQMHKVTKSRNDYSFGLSCCFCSLEFDIDSAHMSPPIFFKHKMLYVTWIVIQTSSWIWWLIFSFAPIQHSLVISIRIKRDLSAILFAVVWTAKYPQHYFPCRWFLFHKFISFLVPDFFERQTCSISQEWTGFAVCNGQNFQTTSA